MNANCQHIIEEGHMGGNCKLCGYSEIWEWYGMYDSCLDSARHDSDKNINNQINGGQHTEQIHYEIHDNGN